MHQADVPVHPPHHPVSHQDVPVPIHVEQAVLGGVDNGFVHLGDDALLPQPVHGVDGLVHRLEHGVLAGADDDGGKAGPLRLDIGGVASDQGVTAGGQGLFHRGGQVLMADGGVDFPIHMEKPAHLHGLVKLAAKAADGDFFRVIGVAAFRNGPHQVIAGDGELDGGDLAVARQGFLGGVAAGDDSVVLGGQMIGSVLHRHGLDVGVQPLPFRMLGEDAANLFLQLRVWYNKQQTNHETSSKQGTQTSGCAATGVAVYSCVVSKYTTMQQFSQGNERENLEKREEETFRKAGMKIAV